MIHIKYNEIEIYIAMLNDLEIFYSDRYTKNNSWFYEYDKDQFDMIKSLLQVRTKLVEKLENGDEIVTIIGKTKSVGTDQKTYVKLFKDIGIQEKGKSTPKALQTRIQKQKDALQLSLRSLHNLSNKESLTALSKKLENDFNLIKRHKKVSSISVDNKAKIVRIYTKDIYCVVDEDTYKLGKYEISLCFIGKFSRIYIKNMNRLYADQYECEAPHIERGGYACFGNIESLLPKLLATADIYAAVVMIIRYLESFNKSDDRAWRYIKAFPIVKGKSVS